MTEATKEKLDEKLNKEEVDFNMEKVVSDMVQIERCNRYSAEIKIFFLLKGLINILDRYTESPQDALKLIACGYKRTLNHFQIGLYSADKWSLNIIEGLAKYIECNWKNKLNAQLVCKFTHIEVLKDMMYIILFEIESECITSSDIVFFITTNNFFK